MTPQKIRMTTLLAVTIASLATATSAQTNYTTPPRTTTSKILYHGGPVATGGQNLYFVFYGCWGTGFCPASDNQTMLLLGDFASTLGNTPYAQINGDYTDASGRPASAAYIYGGAVIDNSYSHSSTLTEADLVAIIGTQILSFALPHDPQGIYIVFTSADIALVDGTTQFCLTCCQRHGRSMINGAFTNWGFVGHTNRCPGACGIPAGVTSANVTPNGDLAGDSMASWLAHTLTEIVTNPDDASGWYDRYGLEDADKCLGTYGTIYRTATGAFANIRLGARDFLLQQNWVKSGNKPHCGMTRQ